MAHYAKIGLNGTVLSLHVVADDVQTLDGVDNEAMGVAYLTQLHGWPIWKRYSMNTDKGVHLDKNQAPAVPSATPEKAFRGNAASISGTYDEDNDIFLSKQPHASWSKDVATASWKAPITYPTIIDDGSNPGDGESVAWAYQIYWDEAAYQANNSTGWKATRTDDTNDPKTVYSWNGTAWA